MPIELGLASSHAPAMHMRRDKAKPWLERVLTLANERGYLISSAAAKLTLEDLEGHWARFRANYGALRGQLEKYDPDTVILVGGSNSEMFKTERKAKMAIFTGEEAFGLDSGASFAGMNSEDNYTRLKTNRELAKQLLKELSANKNLDIAESEVFVPRGQAMLADDFANPPEALPRKDLPVVIISLRYGDNYNGPMQLSGYDCYELGQSLARILENDPRRIAIYGSGGLSHDPAGPRALYVDEPLDRWILEQISNGKGQELRNLFEFDSMTLRGGSREIAAWIVAAGAMEYMGSKATIVDYTPDAIETQTGIGFAYWPMLSKQRG